MERPEVRAAGDTDPLLHRGQPSGEVAADEILQPEDILAVFQGEFSAQGKIQFRGLLQVHRINTAGDLLAHIGGDQPREIFLSGWVDVTMRCVR